VGEQLHGVGLEDPGREAEIIESMADSNWWHHYKGKIAPAPPLPTRFSLLSPDVAATIGVDSTSSAFPRPYYLLVGGGLSLLRRLPVLTDMYVMRVLSAILAVLTLWTAWLGARLVFGEALAMTIVAVLAVHPQFVIASTAAGRMRW
jgi:hypothetical protein